LKKPVAGGVPEGIVDVLETIQVQEQHGDSRLVTHCQENGLINPVIEEHTIGQAGQEIVLGRMDDQRFSLFSRGDVADRCRYQDAFGACQRA
jgi:hypothetical protein